MIDDIALRDFGLMLIALRLPAGVGTPAEERCLSPEVSISRGCEYAEGVRTRGWPATATAHSRGRTMSVRHSEQVAPRGGEGVDAVRSGKTE